VRSWARGPKRWRPTTMLNEESPRRSTHSLHKS